MERIKVGIQLGTLKKFMEEDPHATLKTLQDAAEAGFDTVKSAHIADYKQYYDRVALHLGKNETELIPTNIRLENFSPDSTDMAMYELLFNFGRYLLIASSRAGSQATNLQGK